MARGLIFGRMMAFAALAVALLLLSLPEAAEAHAGTHPAAAAVALQAPGAETEGAAEPVAQCHDTVSCHSGLHLAAAG